MLLRIQTLLLSTMILFEVKSNYCNLKLKLVVYSISTDVMYWIEALSKQLMWSTLPKGNQSVRGQKLDLNYLTSVSPMSLAVDWITGNLYLGMTDPVLINDYIGGVSGGNNRRVTNH